MLRRYLEAKEKGLDPYFDADDIVYLLDSFEDSNDYEYYDEILALGLRLHPHDPDLNIKHAIQLAQQEKYEEALTLIESVEDDPDNEDLEMVRMGCYCATDRYPEARKIMKMLIDNDCDYLEAAFEDMTALLNDLEKFKEARDLLDLGMNLFPDNPILRIVCCHVLQAEGKIEEAIKLCNALIDEDPFSYEAWYTLGRMYALDNQLEKAIEAFDFALACNDSDTEVKVMRAYCLYMNESYERALEEYQAIAENCDEEMKARIYPLMADCDMKMERFEDAFQLFNAIIDSPYLEDGATVTINYIRCCVETQHRSECLKTILKAVSLYPDNVQILSIMVLLLVNQGMNREAIPYFEGIIENLEKQEKTMVPGKQTEECYKMLQTGQQYYIKGEIDKAITCFQDVLKLNPKSPMAHMYLAVAYLEKNDRINFSKHMRQLNLADMPRYLYKAGYTLNPCKPENVLKPDKRQIRPEDLAKDYLNNKENRN